MEDKQILVSLGDDRAKYIGEVLGNKSCVRILDLLASSDLTVSDIAVKLKMPINTVDYNVKKLVKSGLIEKASHWWSVKGKKMPVYRVSDRKILISPRRVISKTFLWIFGLTGFASLVVKKFVVAPEFIVPQSDVAEGMLLAAAPKMEELAVNAGARDIAMGTASDVGFWINLSSWEWFLFGAWFAIFLFFVFSFISERKNRSYYHEN